ncbi:hypothetical protein AGMMS49982_01450 [Bacteroidia bacterium]|nr:hypothetical protein AGMMS49982_01450 [Bacteroidia bacterium]
MKKTTSFLCVALLMAVCASCSSTVPDIYATLYGVVSDSETSDPIANASVVLSPGGKSKTTGSDGRYEFNDLDATQYTITVQKTGYQTNRKTVSAVSAEQTEANIPLTKSN